MRISSNQINTAGLQEILRKQSEVRETQLQISTQRRFLTPADDPVAATSALNIETEISLTEQFNRNGIFAENNNELEESILTGVTENLFRVRDLMISLGNGIYGQEELQGLKAEVVERLDAIAGLANSQSSNGEYVFSGFQSDTKPYVKDASGNYIYQGDNGQRQLKVSSGTSVAISDSGQKVFGSSFTGNKTFSTSANAANTGSGSITVGSYQGASQFLAEPYQINFTAANTYEVVGVNSGTTIVPATAFSPGDNISFLGVSVEVNGTPAAGDSFNVDPSQRQDIFTTLQNVITMVDNFTGTPASRAQFETELDSQLANFDNAFDTIDLVRADVGSRLNAIETATFSNESLVLNFKTTLSKIQDLDMVEAASRLSRQTTTLEAAQASFVRVQNLSIFNFLR
jgi:flagellar hook-associated protein 3 FlgL